MTGIRSSARTGFEDYDSRALVRWKTKRPAKVTIERNEHTPFAHADIEEDFVGYALEILVTNGHRVVAGAGEEIQAAATDVLVQLELHEAAGTRMIRSRAASAP